MNCNDIDFSVIIPQRNSIGTLPRLFDSIPESDRIEIIVVDNTPKPVTKDEVGINRNYQLLWSAPERHAGGARNVGIENAHGKWLLFADADDFFANGAFDAFETKVRSDADLVFWCMDGVKEESGERSSRGDRYTRLIRGFLKGSVTEESLRLGFASPCCKMVRRDFVVERGLRFDEIKAGNDIYFSLVTGFYADRIEAVDEVVYVATESGGTLTRRSDYDVVKARLYSKLHCNEFLRTHNCHRPQHSVMFALYESRRFGLLKMMEFVRMIASFHQNPFVGAKGWLRTLLGRNDVEQRVCVILNMAPYYRKEIFEMMDKKLDCVWYTGEPVENIKPLNMSSFRHPVVSYITIKVGKHTVWQRSLLRLVFCKDFTTFIFSDDIRCMSSWLFAIVGRLMGKRVISWTHGWYGKETRLIAFIKRIYYGLFYKILLYGFYAKDLMMKEGFDESKLIVIHNSLAYTEQLALRQSISPTEIYKSHFKNDNRNLIFVGRLTKVKRLDMIVNALCDLNAKSARKYNLTIVGGGVEQEALVDLACKLGIEASVWFYGPCYDEKELSELIYNADLCVSPGNVGLTALHSLSFGTPVLTHNDFKWQMPEFEIIKEGVTGCLFTKDDLDSMCSSISDWFERNGDRRDEVRNACMKEVDTSWTPEYQMKGILKAIE